jgi:hypothetical protein
MGMATEDDIERWAAKRESAPVLDKAVNGMGLPLHS